MTVTDKAAVAALVKAMAAVARQGVYSCSVAHYDANGFPAPCPDGPQNEAEAILAALPAGWTLTNAAPDAALLALREAIQYGDDAARMAALRDTAPAADAIKSEIEKPWREALWGTRVREMNKDGSPCWCDARYPERGHQEHCTAARALLTEDAKP